MSLLETWVAGEHSADGVSHPTYRKGSGPGVVLIHEIPGLTPEVIGFAEEVVAAGHTVVLPHLFGKPEAPMSLVPVASVVPRVCVSKEFTTMAVGRTSPIAGWLRDLARTLHAELGGPGVGALGMCFTGGFALAMMTEPSVVAPVLSQPSMPAVAGSKTRAAGFDASPAEVACARRRFAEEDLSMIGLRYKSDVLVPDARFESYRREFGDRFEAIELEDEDAAPAPIPPHSVLTLHLKADGPSKAAEDRVLEFFKARTGA